MELHILDWIGTLHCPLLNHFFIGITSLGNGGMFWIILGVLLFTQKKYRALSIGMFACLILTSILGEGIIKHIVCRARPFTYRPNMSLLIAKPASYSFPSGHTGSSFTCAVFLFLCNKELGIPALILASFIAFSRMYLYVHFPSDILGGIMLGTLVSCILYFCIFQKRYSNL